MLASENEKLAVKSAIETVSVVRASLEPMNKHRLADEASRHLEQALTCLALLAYTPQERPRTVA